MRRAFAPALLVVCVLAACASGAPRGDELAGLPASVEQTVVQGSNAADVSFVLTNKAPASDCKLYWLADASDDNSDITNRWLTATGPDDGTVGSLEVGESVNVSLHFQSAQLSVGTHVGTVVITAGCQQNHRNAIGSPANIPVSLTVAPFASSLYLYWKLDGADAGTACPPGATVDARGFLPGGAVKSAPCSDGQLVMPELAPGARTAVVRLLNASQATLDVLDAPLNLLPGAPAELDVDFLATAAETDGVARAANSPSCVTDTNLLSNGGFESVAPLGAHGANLLPIDWSAASGTPITLSADDSYGEALGFGSYCTSVAPYQLDRFVAASSFVNSTTGEAIAQVLQAPLAAGHEYRLRAFLRPANTASGASSPGGYYALLTNDDRSARHYLGRFVPAPDNTKWVARSFGFRAPDDAASYTRLELGAFSHDYSQGSEVGLDGVALSETTGCAFPELKLAWTVGGQPASAACPDGDGVRVRVLTQPVQTRSFPCAVGGATLSGLTAGAVQVMVDLIDPINQSVVDTQELVVDLRAGNRVPSALAHVDLLALANDFDGTPAIPTAPACDDGIELLRNGGFEASASNQRGAQLLPAEWTALGSPEASTLSIDGAYGVFPGSGADQWTPGGLPAEGARFLTTRAGTDYVAQLLSSPMVPGHTYRVRAMVRKSSASGAHPANAGFNFVLAGNYDPNSGGPSSGQELGRLLPPDTSLGAEKWQSRSFVFQARAGADTFSTVAFRAEGLTSTDGFDLSPANAAPAIDALSLQDITSCAVLAQSRIRVTWSLRGAAACATGDVVNLSIDGILVSSPDCARGAVDLPGGSSTSAHVYAQLMHAGAAVQALESNVSMLIGGAGRVHFNFQESLTGYDGNPCATQSNACSGEPVNLFTNASFEALPQGANLDTDYSIDPTGWSHLGNAYLYNHDGKLGGTTEGYGPIHAFSQIEPKDGLRFRSAFASTNIDQTTGEGSDRIMQSVNIVAGHRYRLRAWVRRGSPVSDFTGKGASFRIRLGPDTDPFPSGDPPKQNLRTNAAWLCPVRGTDWEERSVTFTAPTSGPYLYFDAYDDDGSGIVGLDDVSLTELTNDLGCAP